MRDMAVSCDPQPNERKPAPADARAGFLYHRSDRIVALNPGWRQDFAYPSIGSIEGKEKGAQVSLDALISWKMVAIRQR